jgi:hypothetical protein
MKELIIAFLEKNPTKKFLSYTNPSATAYEKFSKKNPDVSLSFFNKIFKEVHLSHLPDELTYNNLSEIISYFPKKYEHGFIRSEIEALLKKYKLSSSKFNKEMGVNSAMSINNETVNYDTDVEMSIRCIIRGKTKNALEWD